MTSTVGWKLHRGSKDDAPRGRIPDRDWVVHMQRYPIRVSANLQGRAVVPLIIVSTRVASIDDMLFTRLPKTVNCTLL